MVAGYIKSNENQGLAGMQTRNRIADFATGNGESISRWITGGNSGADSIDAKHIIECMSKGDSLYVNDVATLGSTFKELLSVLTEAVRRGILIYGVDDGYTNSNVENNETYILALEHMSDAYKLLCSIKIRAALSSRRKAGVRLGRPRGSCVQMNVLERDIKRIKAALAKGEKTDSLCRKYDVSQSTFRRFLRKNGLGELRRSKLGMNAGFNESKNIDKIS